MIPAEFRSVIASIIRGRPTAEAAESFDPGDDAAMIAEAAAWWDSLDIDVLADAARRPTR